MRTSHSQDSTAAARSAQCSSRHAARPRRKPGPRRTRSPAGGSAAAASAACRGRPASAAAASWPSWPGPGWGASGRARRHVQTPVEGRCSDDQRVAAVRCSTARGPGPHTSRARQRWRRRALRRPTSVSRLARAPANPGHTHLFELQQLLEARLPGRLPPGKLHAQPLEAAPPVVAQRALPPLVLLPGEPGVQRRVRARHARVAVLRVEGCQLCKARCPHFVKGVVPKAQCRQALLPCRRQASSLPGMPLLCHPIAQACASGDGCACTVQAVRVQETAHEGK